MRDEGSGRGGVTLVHPIFFFFFLSLEDGSIKTNTVDLRYLDFGYLK